MSSIACPHCAQNFNNYNNGIKATKCPYCGGGIGYVEGNPILDKSIFINHFWKIAIVLSIMARQIESCWS
jgi:hypothetical protein